VRVDVENVSNDSTGTETYAVNRGSENDRAATEHSIECFSKATKFSLTGYES
jgi:hypothetical protein